MLNLNGGTVNPGLTIPAGYAVVFFFHNTSHLIVVWGLMILTIVSLFFLTATLSRFFINLKKYFSEFENPEKLPR